MPDGAAQDGVNVQIIDLQCPICLDFYTSPVSLCCGHTVDRECLAKSVDAQDEESGADNEAKQGYECPICRASANRDVLLQSSNVLILQLATRACRRMCNVSSSLAGTSDAQIMGDHVQACEDAQTLRAARVQIARQQRDNDTSNKFASQMQLAFGITALVAIWASWFSPTVLAPFVLRVATALVCAGLVLVGFIYGYIMLLARDPMGYGPNGQVTM